MPGISSIQPILASSLFSPGPSERDAVSRKRKNIETEITEVDEALRGGLGVGMSGVTCISGEKGVGRTGLALALLTTHLLAAPANQGVLVDTTGTFDVVRLYNTILTRLRHRRAGHSATKGAEAATADPASTRPQEDDGEAAKVLDRVQIMRVFDFVGMVEAVGEVKERLGAQQREREQKEAERLRAAPVTPVAEQQPRGRQEGDHARKLQRVRSVVADSEDEEDEMLFDEPVQPDTEPGHGAEQQATDAGKHSNRFDEDMGEEEEPGRVGMMIVDNITHVVSPMMKTSYVQASALLTSFLRSLGHLTRARSLSTVLINATTAAPSFSANPSAKPDHRSIAQNPQNSPRITHSPLSIFASSRSIAPALSPLLPAHVDLHLLLTTQPLTRRDAVTLHSATAHGSPQIEKRAERVGVVEVLSDRYADRVGRWAPFAVEANGVLVQVDVERRG